MIHIPSTKYAKLGATILDCLKDPDVSIRQRALELTHQLVNANNVVELVREMLNYLVVAPPEHRALLCSRVRRSASVVSYKIKEKLNKKLKSGFR